MTTAAASYYADLTAQYRHYGGNAHGWHYGLWDADVRSHETALQRSNERLLRNLDVSSETRILDVGFGAGGFSVWAASRYGAQVTGITICPGHVDVARELAARHGVAGNCRFITMNMDDLAFDPDTFDIVVNQETACYARDKRSYLRQVLHVLKPGGVWRNLDFAVQANAPFEAATRDYVAVCDGFHIPSLSSLVELETIMRESHFDVIECRDLTDLVLPTATMIRRQCYLPLLMARLRLDWMVYSRDPSRRRNRRGHIIAAHGYSRGLERGYFRYVYCSARKPWANTLGCSA
jgi:cyclopropane fatty-acyl-phospholipid synthase-like methyltransferase